MSQNPGIVTPEAVILDFATAGVGSRIGAQVLDMMLQGLGLLVSSLALATLSDVGGLSWVGVAAAFFLVFGFLFGYPALFETFWGGRTPGKAAMGLRVVTVEGGPISFRHAAIRSGFGLIEVIGTVGVIAFLTIFFSKRNQRLGDLAAGTLVLRQRSGTMAASATQFVPLPGTEAYVESLDVSALTNDDYQAIRTFLLRSPSLSPYARDQLAEQLATQMMNRLRLAPLPGMFPGQYLISLAAAYQRRFSQH